MSDVDEIKSRLNIVDIIGQRVTLKKAGRNFKGLCPFHKEKTPSFMVSPERQSFHCFGCGKGGSVIDFVMEYNHVDFLEALEDLAARANVTLTKRSGQSPEEKLRERIFAVNALVSDYYHYLLTTHRLGEKAMLYLKNRGISDKSIKTFGLGYSPNSWDGLIAYLQKKGHDGKFLEQAGLVVRGKRGWYDRFRGRIMFTLRDHRGNVVGFSGRVLDPSVKEAKYINTAETPVYIKSNVLFGLDVTKDAIAKSGEAIVMEGEMDVISSFQEGIANVVAIKGSALTEGHVNLLKRFAQKLVFCLDSDLAGDAAARRGIDVAETAGLDMKAIIIPSGKDPDEAAREDPVAFKKAVQHAVPIYDYFLTSIAKRYNLASPFDKRKASDEFLPMLSRMSNTIVQGHYVKKFADLLDLSEETILDGMKKVKRPLVESLTPVQKQTKEIRPYQETMERYLLALILQGETRAWLEELGSVVDESDLFSSAVKQVITYLHTHLSTHEQFMIQSFALELPSELVPVVDEAYLWDMSEFGEGEKFAKEWKKSLVGYRKWLLRERIKKLMAEGLDAEAAQARLASYTQELRTLEKDGDI